MLERNTVINPTRLLAFGFMLTMFTSFGQTFFISTFNDAWKDTFELSDGHLGRCYSGATFLSGITILWLGKKVDTVDLRLFTHAVLIGLATACVVLGASPGVWALVPAFYLLRLTGQGLLSHAAVTSMARYFTARRGTALALAGLGFTVGEAALPAVSVAMQELIDWRMIWYGIAAIVLFIMVPVTIVLLTGHVRRHTNYLEQTASETKDSTDNNSQVAQQRHHWTRAEVLRDRRFYLVAPCVVSPAFILTGLFFHQQHMISFMGWEKEFFAGCFVIFAFTQVPSGLISGPLVDRVGAAALLRIMLLPLIIGLFVLAASRSQASAIAFMCLSGLTVGLIGTIVGALWAELYGTRHLGSIRALVTATMVFSTSASPWILGELIDEGVSMQVIAGGCAIGAIITTVVAVIGIGMPNQRPRVSS